MKKVLVTGATGFIGRHVVKKLLAEGCEVIICGTDIKKASVMEWFGQVQYQHLDLKTLEPEKNYFSYFRNPDLLIHLAWEGLPNYLNEFHLTENLPRHKVFLTNMLSNGLKDLTVAGTCFEYGMKSGCLEENMDSGPCNPYAESKNKLRDYIETLKGRFEFDFKWPRLFYMYGEGQNSKSLISQLEESIAEGAKVFNMSGGEQIRDFLPVEEVARLIVKIALQTKVSGIINCCSGQPISVKQFVKDYLAAQNKSIGLNLGFYPYAEYEPMEFWGDINKLKSIF